MLSKPSQPAQQVTLNDEATIDCPICLDTVSTPAFKLSCGHKFCEACLSTYATTIAGQQSSPATPKLACPCCVKTLSNSECSSLGIRLLVQSSATTPESQGWWALSHQRRTSNAAEENHGQAADLGRAAGRIPIRYCPYCRVPIIKEGGCNSMRCGSCQRRFEWLKARPARPCRHAHDNFEACAFCSTAARGEAAAMKGAKAVGVLPLAALVVGASLTAVSLLIPIVLVPAAIFGPMAVAYEAAPQMRKTKEAKKNRYNPFIYPASSGGIFAGMVVVATCGYESD